MYSIPTLIAFGSCAGLFGYENAEMFRTIDLLSPDAFIWLGDVVYADEMSSPLSFTPTSHDVWAKKFTDMKDADGYKELRSHRRILGVWDDHDYGTDGGNKHNPSKEFARQVYLEFLDEKPESPRWTRAGGIYESYYIEAPDGSGRNVKVILLDVRFSADEWRPDGDCLGEEQWTWLENELKTPGNLTVIGSGLQVTAEDRFNIFERWHDRSRERLHRLLNRSPNVILLSGDIHFSEILLDTCQTYPLYEFTSSGMTHTISTTFGILHHIFTDILLPYTNNVGHRVFDKNFGLIAVDWNMPDPVVTLSIHDTNGKSLLSHSFGLRALSEAPVKDSNCSVLPIERYRKHVIWSLVKYIIPVLLAGYAIRTYNLWARKPKRK
mmetsp:Transcript_6028/g.10633  ORF Transcript_6028/g.10633 Transcript_6028/m.10633 type:complete len:380 (+) Transcript_6028:618-1757(+)